jgi:hypothetical protein
LKLNTANIDSCVRGMSDGIVRKHLLEPGSMEKYCSHAGNYKLTCYQGSVNYHLFIIGKVDQTRNEMCNKFTTQQNRQDCNEMIEISPFR